MPFLLIDKKAGITSNDVVTKVKKTLGVNKAGHSGTLDPFATGLLIIATEGDTKFLDRLLRERKIYSGLIKFGETTISLDTEEEIIETKDVSISQSQVEEIIGNKFIGKINQIPPAFSAIKVKGKKSYELARKGKAVELKSVERTIYKFEIEKVEQNTFKFTVDVSSGTYIRALARDLGLELNAPVMLTKLKREKIGIHNVIDATDEDNLKPIQTKDFIKLSWFTINDDQMKWALEGKKLSFDTNEREILITNDSELLLMERTETEYKIKKRIR